MTKFSAAQQHQLAQIGAFLRDNREKQEKSLEDIAIRTYIRPLLLNGIETGNPELLPEPIFVQGFIRRYAEALGINGMELAQQFTVNSIPSTPRPTRQPASAGSGTTRISKVTANQPPTTAQTTSSTPMFSTTGTPPVSPSAPPSAPPAVSERREIAEIGSGDEAIAPNANPEIEPEIEFDTSFIIDNDRMSGVSMDTAPENTPENTPESAPEINGGAAPAAFESTVNILSSDQPGSAQADLTQTDIGILDIERTEPNSPDVSEANISDASIAQKDLNRPDSQSIDDAFASQVAALNQDDVAHASPDLDPSSSDVNRPVNLDNTEADPSLPTATAATQIAVPKASEPLGASRSTLPVGVEMKGTSNAPNLQPFILGGVLAAALTAGVVILFGFLGGRDRPPNTADSLAPAEQVIETAPPLDSETLAENPSSTTSSPPTREIVPTTPPVSSAPVYVEAKATSEAWVSITVDDNPIPIFEGTLEPGETQVWEAQKNIIVYAGDAGALELAANGNEAEVMGEPGQPTEKIFPSQPIQ